MRCKKLEGSGYETVTVWKAGFYSEHAQNSVQSRTHIVKRYSARKGEKLKNDPKSVKRRPPVNVLQQITQSYPDPCVLLLRMKLEGSGYEIANNFGDFWMCETGIYFVSLNLS